MLYSFICESCGSTEDGSIMTVLQMERRKTEPCASCGKTTVRVNIKKAPTVFYLGAGFENAWKQSDYSHKSPESQRRLDAALRENDALQHAGNHDPKFIRAGDIIKEAQDKFGE